VEVGGLEEEKTVLAREAVARPDPLPDRVKTVIAESRGSGCGNGHGCLQVRVAQTDWSV
jgi:hypothetical protein